jgi:hypothetical protein
MITILPATAALLAALAIVPWGLGVPGVAGTRYGLGWAIGFYALVFYLSVYGCWFAIRLVLRVARSRVPRWLDWIMLGALAGLVLAQIVAWVLMLG